MKRDDAIREAGNSVAEMLSQFRWRCLKLSDDELALVAGQLAMLNTTNCPWSEYVIRDLLASEVGVLRQQRAAVSSIGDDT